VPHDQAEARLAAAIAAGGRLVTDKHAPTWWTLADAEGNDVCTWRPKPPLELSPWIRPPSVSRPLDIRSRSMHTQDTY
jgi:hypothetical protein